MTSHSIESRPWHSHRPLQALAAGLAPRLSPALSPALSQALSLGLPVSCAGCGRWEAALCPQCRELLEAEPFAVEHADAVGDLDVLTLATYTGPVRTMVLGWKNGSREDLSEVMERAGRRLGRRWAQAHPPQEVWPGPLPAAPALLVVPAPSGIVRRMRGRLVAANLADAVARGIAGQWAHRDLASLVLSADLLRRRGGGAHQTGRSSRQRRGNRAATPALLAPVSGLPVLLVDDVVTTGATLGACARALQEAGGRVLGALTLSAAPPPARKRLTVPARTSPDTPGERNRGGTEPEPRGTTDAPGARIDPATPGLSACGDQRVRCACGTCRREA